MHILSIRTSGKTNSDVEFGAKLAISIVNGFIYMETLSFDAFNEGTFASKVFSVIMLIVLGNFLHRIRFIKAETIDEFDRQAGWRYHKGDNQRKVETSLIYS